MPLVCDEADAHTLILHHLRMRLQLTKLAEGHILKELFPIPDELNQALDDEQEAVVETIAVLVKTYQA